MDSDFLNAYVKKLKDLNTDLIDKNLLLQTQVELQGKIINELKASIEQLTVDQQQAKKSTTEDF